MNSQPKQVAMDVNREDAEHKAMEAFRNMVDYYTDLYLRDLQYDFGLEFSTANLESETFCSLDPSLLDDDDGTALYTGPSFAAALDHSVWDSKEEETLKKEAIKALLFVNAPNNKAVLQMVFDLASNNLRAMGIDPAKVSIEIKPRLAVLGLEYAKRKTQHLIRCAQTSKPGSQSKPKPQMKAFFECQLCRLRGGRGSDVVRVPLYLDYSHTFVQFLDSMNRETMDCVIPPLGWEDLSADGAPKKLADPIYRKRNANEHGYSLLDGPWIGCISTGLETGGREKILITDEISYKGMIKKIKNLNIASFKETGVQDTFVVVYHSMDYASQRAAEAAMNKDLVIRAEEEEEFRDACARGEIYGVDKDYPEDWGEPYLDWMRRDTMERMSREAAEAATKALPKSKPAASSSTKTDNTSTTSTRPGSGHRFSSGSQK